MKRNNFIKVCFLAFVLCLSLPMFISCGSDKDDEFIEGDATMLRAELAACHTMADTALASDYSAVSINQFKSKLDIITSALISPIISAQEVLNMTIHLSESKSRFLNSKMIGIPSSALIAGWGFNEGAGTSLTGEGSRALVAALKPGPSEIFSVTGMPEFVEDGIDKALRFKNGAHLEVASYNPADFLGKQLSIAVWLKPEVIKGGNYIASMNYWNNWKFQIQEQGKGFFTVKSTAGHVDADNEADLSVAPGNWKHVVVILDLGSNKLSFYINGLLTKEWTSTTKPNLVGNQAPPYVSSLGTQLPLMIGAATTYAEANAAWTWSGWDTPTAWDHYDGLMDEIKFYDIALLDGQVQWLYNQEVEKLNQ